MVITLGQQYNVGEKPTVILYTYINRHAGTPTKGKTNKCTSSNNKDKSNTIIIETSTAEDHDDENLHNPSTRPRYSPTGPTLESPVWRSQRTICTQACIDLRSCRACTTTRIHEYSWPAAPNHANRKSIQHKKNGAILVDTPGHQTETVSQHQYFWIKFYLSHKSRLIGPV